MGETAVLDSFCGIVLWDRVSSGTIFDSSFLYVCAAVFLFLNQTISNLVKICFGCAFDSGKAGLGVWVEVFLTLPAARGSKRLETRLGCF